MSLVRASLMTFGAAAVLDGLLDGVECRRRIAAGEAVFRPGIGRVAVAADFPKTRFVLGAELD